MIWHIDEKLFEGLEPVYKVNYIFSWTVRHWKENLPTDLDVNSFQSNNLSSLVLFLEIETFPPINKPKHLFVIAWTSIQIYL